MNLLNKVGGVFMAVRLFVKPRRGMYYAAITFNLEDEKPLKVGKKSILQTIRAKRKRRFVKKKA